jgi:hypothetical protein
MKQCTSEVLRKAETLNDKEDSKTRNMNTKIWFLLLAAGALSCAGCATETAKQIQGLELQAQHAVEKTSGKPRKDWGPAETEEYNDLFLEALQQVKPRDYVRLNATTGQLEAPGLFRLPLSTNDAARSQPVTEYGNGIQNVSRVGQ